MAKHTRRNRDARRKKRKRGKATRPPARPTAGAASRPTTRDTPRPSQAPEAPERSPGRVIRFWWERYPGRLYWELQALAAARLPYRIREDARLNGRVVIEVDAEVRGEPTTLTAVFPDTYPELRFELYAPALSLPRHQNIIGKNLCLLGRNTAEWKVTDTLAAFISERLPLVLRAVYEPGSVPELDQGEPVTTYYEYKPGSVMLLPAFALELQKSVSHGDFQFAIQSNTNGRPVRGAICEIHDADGRRLGRADESTRRNFPEPLLSGRWVRLDAAPPTTDVDDIITLASARLSGLEKPRWQKVDDRPLDVIGVVFPEEVSSGRTEDGWLFLVRTKGSSYLCRGQRFSVGDQLARIPHLRHLRQRVVGVTGLGGLGGPSVIEFARALVGEIRLVDDDIVEVGTTVRWPLGITAAGNGKVKALYDHISQNFPFSTVRGYELRIGGANRQRAGRSEIDLLSQFLDGLDLLYDATAEVGVQHLLSNLVRPLGIPQVYVSATEGLWGGIVARCIPGKTGCWYCLKLHEDDGSIPLPRGNQADTVQPRGCGHPTFVGAGFDLLPLVAQGVRLAIQTLAGPLSAEDELYPDADGDVYVLNLRDQSGDAILPEWSSFPLDTHPACPYCTGASG